MICKLCNLRPLGLYDAHHVSNNILKRLPKVIKIIVYNYCILTNLNLNDNNRITNEGICDLILLTYLNLKRNKLIGNEGISKLIN